MIATTLEIGTNLTVVFCVFIVMAAVVVVAIYGTKLPKK